jgi:hypothetical protein
VAVTTLVDASPPPSRRRTIPPTAGFTAEQIHGAPASVPAWVPIVDHVLAQLPTVVPAVAGNLKLSPGGGHIVALWIVVAAMAVGGVLHVLGDGTLRDKVDRTECHVEWLVERAVAEDRGQPPPPFSPLACDR